MNTGDEAPPVRSQPGVSGPAPLRVADAAGGTEPGVLTDVVFEKDVRRSARAVAIIIAFVCALITAIVVLVLTCPFTIVPGGRPGEIAVCSALVVAMILLFASWLRKRARVLVREAIAGAAHCGVAPAMHHMLDGMCGLDAGAGLRAMLDSLVGQGHTGTTLRICKTNEMLVLEPLTYPFEPQPLNEMHSALMRQQIAEGGRATGQAPSAARSFARNVALKGGWALLVIIGFEWVAALIKAIAQRTITWHLLLFSLALLILALAPANRVFTHQWFVVPGEIILRTAGWLQSRWSLHLFERRRSVLCVSHWSRNVWRADIADAETSSDCNLTRDEAEFLLRAWLSSLPPPPIERLTDLQ